jgi:phage terminase Nu1 subunit (DNA packaging protein)
MQSFDLEEALKLYPLPDGIEDEVINRGQLATALDVSEPMISKYLEQGLPVLSRGSNGQSYEFRPSECYAWKMARDAELRGKKMRADRAAAQLSLLFRNEADPEDPTRPIMTAAERSSEAKADYDYNRASELRGELVRANKVRELFETILSEFRTQIVSLVDFAEMEFGLTAEQVRKLEVRCDATLIQARHEFSAVAPGEVSKLSAHQSVDSGPTPLAAD